MANADAELWKVYANKIKDLSLTDGGLGSNERIYIPPLNAQGIMAGDQVDQNLTNYGIWKSADSVLNVDQPMFLPGEEQYSIKCLEYLCNVAIETDNAGLKQALQDRQKNINTTIKEFKKILNQTKTRWLQSFDKESTNFGFWVVQNAPQYTQYKQELAGLIAAYVNMMAQAGGSNSTLEQAINKVQIAAVGEVSMPGMTMAVCYQVNSKSTANAGTFEASFNMHAGYGQQVQRWKGSASGTSTDVSFNVNPSEASQYNWSEVGHQKTKVSGSANFAPFFSIDYSQHSSQSDDRLQASDVGSDLDVEIRAHAIQSFDVQPSSPWYSEKMRSTYPELNPDAPKHLSDPMVQVSKLIVGYNVSLKVTMSESSYSKIMAHINTAKNESEGASISLFGFRVRIGDENPDEQVNVTNWNKVETDNSAHTLIIPASDEAMPVLLAVVGTVME